MIIYQQQGNDVILTLMNSFKNIVIFGSAQKPIVLDIFFEDNGNPKPVVIYAHGFNGFKDWGNFDLIAKRFAAEGFVFVKFNFSHNGTTPEHPEAFADLEAFGNNNYSIELEDIKLVVDWVCDPNNSYKHIIDKNRICLIGHSMGGGIAILHAARDRRIHSLVTWASICVCKTPWGSWPPEKMKEWKESGVQYYINGRTKQHMPLYYQLYEDYVKHEDQFNIQKAIASLDIPVLICHGTSDEAVPIESALALQRWQPAAKLFTVESDHVFGRKHPWEKPDLPGATEKVVNATVKFLQQ
jgi:dienelactone hydrolase